jgi:hypothetical protein
MVFVHVEGHRTGVLRSPLAGPTVAYRRAHAVIDFNHTNSLEKPRDFV